MSDTILKWADSHITRVWANVMPYDGGLIPEKDRYNTKTKAIDLENLIYDKEKNLGVNIKHQMDI